LEVRGFVADEVSVFLDSGVESACCGSHELVGADSILAPEDV
jgi:hypothetical protein